MTDYAEVRLHSNTALTRSLLGRGTARGSVHLFACGGTCAPAVGVVVIRATPRTGPEFDADQLRSGPQRSEDTRAFIHLDSAGTRKRRHTPPPLTPAHRHDDC